VSIFFAILLTVAAFGYVAYPLLRGPRPQAAGDGGDEEVDGLLTKRDTTYSMLKELEFDHESGLLTEEDYLDLEDRYRDKAITILKDLDEAREAAPAADETSDAIERQVAELRREKQRFCSQCGVAVKPADRFCANCGAGLPGGAAAADGEDS
jgi:hypothetical protein